MTQTPDETVCRSRAHCVNCRHGAFGKFDCPEGITLEEAMLGIQPRLGDKIEKAINVVTLGWAKRWRERREKSGEKCNCWTRQQAMNRLSREAGK